MKSKTAPKSKAPKKPTKSGQKKPASGSAQKPAVVMITGESPLVVPYAETCRAHGYTVCISLNEPPIHKIEWKSDNIKVSDTIPTGVSLALELTNLDLAAKRKNLEKLDRALEGTAVILTSSVTVTATEQSRWLRQPHRLVGIGALPTLIDKSLVEVAPTIYSPRETLDVVTRFYHSIGKEIEFVQDRIGMVMPRILCQVINEAAFAVTEELASPQDIDLALRLGLHFPFGPIEWSEQIGLRQVYGVLDALHNDLHEERYRPAPLLKQMSIVGEWWKQS